MGGLRGSPGAGRAKLRLSRGLPCYLIYDVTLYTIGRPIEAGTHGGHFARQDDAQSPGSDGASPYQWRNMEISNCVRRGSNPQPSAGGGHEIL